MSNDIQNYGFNQTEAQPTTNTGGVQIEQTKAAKEVEASLIIAKRFPRDENMAFERIRRACMRPFLAEQSVYAYPKGKEVVTGPSIRLAEVLAQNWGNIAFGIKEISQENGMSLAKAYAWDLETNVIQEKEFHVPHRRHTKSGSYALTDPREIYELVANNGARRLRACILGVIPGDIAEAAVEECKKTMTGGKEPIADRVRKLVAVFSEFGVSVEHIEKRLGHKLEVMMEAELVTLRAVYKSLRDGMAKREDFFDFGDQAATSKTEQVLNSIVPPPPIAANDTTAEIIPVTQKTSEKLKKKAEELEMLCVAYEVDKAEINGWLMDAKARTFSEFDEDQLDKLIEYVKKERNKDE